MHTCIRGLLLSGVAAGASLSAQQAAAAGFALLEQNASGLGNAYAGAGAIAEDASTLYFNAAGLTQMTQPSLVISANAVDVNSKFHDQGSVAALGQTLGSEGGNAGGVTVLPALYLAVPLTAKLSGGFGFNAPFGLKTEYNGDWMGRFQAVKSEVTTTNFNTALAFKVTPTISVGLGLDYQTIDAELTSAVNYDAVVAQGLAGPPFSFPPSTILPIIGANPGLQGESKVKGNDSAWGFDAGVLFTPGSTTKIGLSYRSGVSYHLTGDATFTAPTSSNGFAQAVIGAARATALADGPITLNIKLPASARAAFAQQFGIVELLGEVQWTQWSDIQELRINRSNGSLLKNTPENWRDTWRYALGANFKVNNAVKLRVGAAYDESPVPDSTRTPRLPDNDRTWYTVGAQIQATPSLGFDLGYAYIVSKDASLNQSDGYSAAQGYPNGLLLGEQHSTINVYGAQATVKF